MTTRHILLAALLCWAAPAAGQTIKSLGFNTTNGQVVYTGTNTLTFTNSQIGILESGEDVVFLRNQSGALAFYSDATMLATFATAEINFFFPIVFNNTTNAAATRTNLGLGLPALTNTGNVTTMRALAGSTNTNEPYSGTVALTNTNVLTFSNGVLLKIQ
jgi:hypothetical protein